MFQNILTIAVVLSLSACTSIVPSTALRLNALDPFTADPNDMAVALELPAGLALRPATTEMTFKAVHSPSGETVQRDYILDEQRTTDGAVIYTLSNTDIEDLNAMKESLLPWKETSDGNSTLFMGVTSKACRVPDVDVGPDPRVNVALRLEADGPLRPFLRDVTLLEYYEIDALAELPQCSGPF